MTASLRTLIEPLVVGRKPDDPLIVTKRCFSLEWKRARIEAGCYGKLNFHDYRRTSARTKRAAGVDTSIIMEMQGWRTEAMFRRYGIVNRQDKAAALARMEAYDNERRQLQVNYNSQQN